MREIKVKPLRSTYVGIAFIKIKVDASFFTFFPLSKTSQVYVW